MAQHSDLIGTTLGSYRLTKILGVGGMGAVYLGENPEIESRVAIKLLLPEFVTNEEIVKRFLDEARAANRIGHPGIVQIHDAARHDKLGVYLVMEHLVGETLYQLHHRAGPLEPAPVCRLLQQAASALHASHQAGIVHRDLKPANLFLTQDPEVLGGIRLKVLDFGIAKLVEGRDPMNGATETGAFLGSPMFMSPEQCLDSKEVDHRTDIYSLGAIGYHVLSGHYPFEAPSIGRLILMHRSEKPQPLVQLNREVPEAVQQVLDRALEADRERRFQTMLELREALQGVLASLQPGLAPPLSPEPGAGALPPTLCDPDEKPQPPTVADGVAANRSADQRAIKNKSQLPRTTTLSGATGEQTAQAAAQIQRSMVFKVGLGLAAVAAVTVTAVVLTRGPGPAAPPAAMAPTVAPPASQPADPATPDAAAIRQVILTLTVSPAAAQVTLDGKHLDVREIRLAVDGRPRRLRVSAPGHVTHEEQILPTTDRTLHVALKRARRARPVPAAKKPAAKKPAAKKPALKQQPGPKKPYFDEL